MRISQHSLFDLPVLMDPAFLPPGIRPGQGWSPHWPGSSDRPDCSLIFARQHFPQPVPLAFELACFQTPRLLTVLCPGAPEIRVVLEGAMPQTVLAQSPTYAEGAEEAELHLRLSPWPEQESEAIPPPPPGRPEPLAGLRLLGIGPPARPLTFPLSLTDARTREACLGSGWSAPEAQGLWSDGPLARLTLPRQLWRPCRALTFDLSVLPRPEGIPPLALRISSAGRLLMQATFPLAEGKTVTCPLAGCWQMDQALDLDLEFDTPLSPAELGINPDTRCLGVFLRGIDALG